MKNICIESNGLLIFCNFLRLNSQDKNIVMLYDCISENSIGCLYIDEVCLKFIYESETGKHYKVISKNNS